MIIIHFNGWYGVGKKTIAVEVQKQLQEQGLVARLVHNHSLIDAPIQAFGHGNDNYRETVRELRKFMNDKIAKLSPPDEVIMFTNCIAEGHAMTQEYLDDMQLLARLRGVPFLTVTLDCQMDENRERFMSEERGRYLKPRDPVHLETLRANEILSKFQGDADIRIDTTGKSASESAELIMAKIAGLIALRPAPQTATAQHKPQP